MVKWTFHRTERRREAPARIGRTERRREAPARTGQWPARVLGAACVVFAALALQSAARADEGSTPAPTPEEIAVRLADLEAYVTNGAPKKLISAGPGHNAWMMTSAALVLFMTLPGLALFYGGL